MGCKSKFDNVAVVGSLWLTFNPPGSPEGAERDICTHLIVTLHNIVIILSWHMLNMPC